MKAGTSLILMSGSNIIIEGSGKIEIEELKTQTLSASISGSGKIEIDDDQYDAVAETGFINQDEKIIVKQFSSGQLYVAKKD